MRRTAISAALAVAVLAGGAVAAAAVTKPKHTHGVNVAAATKAAKDGGRHETVSDESIVAKAIGITEAQLSTALGNGQTIAAVAKANNVAAQTVIDALAADAQSELAADVTSGRLTQAQADQLKTQITQRVTDQVNGSFHHGGDRSGPGFGGHHETVSDESVVAKAIGITEAQLSTALGNGQTIAAVAKANNVAAQTVIDALAADARSELAADVTSGRLTQAQADQLKTQITQRVTDQVNGSFRHGHDRGGPDDGPNA